MESTCFKECHLWRKYKEHCPNYVVGYWKHQTSGEEIRIEDCTPKRTLEELKAIHNLLIGLQKASNEERNASHGMTAAILQLEGSVLNGPDTKKALISPSQS